MTTQADLRLPLLASVVWGSAVAADLLPLWVNAAGVVLLAGGLVSRGALATALAVVALAFAAIGGVVVRSDAVRDSLGWRLAQEHASVTARVVVAQDPKRLSSRFGDRVTFRASVLEIEGRGISGPSPPVRVNLRADQAGGLAFGQTLNVQGRIAASRDRWLAGVIDVRGPPEVVAGPSWLDRAAGRFRASVRDGVRGWGSGAGLVPALVDGDESLLPPGLDEDFRATSLTHLLAVSGTNLTLLLVFVLAMVRGVGVRGRAVAVCGAITIGAFVLISRAEPSVIRAAAMGVVALVGLGTNGRARGTRALSACVIALVLFDPRVALSLGFTLSAAATAAILLLGPGFRDALARWLPVWLAEAIAVPLAAEVVCAPIVATISGQVSLVGVVTNAVAGPAVGPTTVFGLLAGLVGLGASGLAHLVAFPAVLGARWIIAVAHEGAAHPLSTARLPPGAIGVALLAAVCLAAAVYLPAVLKRRWASALVALALAIVVLVPTPLGGWPPANWVFVACDVGQGDALVLRAGDREAVVVDAGPDPMLTSRCLRELRVRRVPLVVLTHFHADHVDGLPGVLDGRQVEAIEHTDLPDPPDRAAFVERSAGDGGVPLTPAPVGTVRQFGDLTIQVLAPTRPPSPESGSPPNDASVVLLVEVGGVRLLLMGDEEGPSQRVLREAFPALRADVLKVAHHGSAKQDFDLIASLGATIAVISVGVGNSYHHPAPSTLEALHQIGARVMRTDIDGAVAISVSSDGSVEARGRGPVGRP